MRIELQFLKNIDRTLAAYAALLAASVLGAAVMLWHLSVLESGVARLGEELAETQRQVATIVEPTPEEELRWATLENRISSRLLSDSEVAVFLNDVTRLATLYALERVDLNPEEATIPDAPEDPSGSGALARSIGIREYTELTITLTGGYRDTARFIEAVANLPRLIEFRLIEMTRGRPEIIVRMVFRVYRREARAAGIAPDPA